MNKTFDLNSALFVIAIILLLIATFTVIPRWIKDNVDEMAKSDEYKRGQKCKNAFGNDFEYVTTKGFFDYTIVCSNTIEIKEI
jgi:hypothetical protein